MYVKLIGDHYKGRDAPAMLKQRHHGYLTRRHLLQSMTGFALTMSIEGCVQAVSSLHAFPTPHPYGSILSSYRGHKMRVTAVAWSPGGTFIVSGSLDKTVQVWSVTSSNHAKPFVYRGHSAGVRAVGWSPNSQRIVSGSEDTTVHIWDAYTGQHTNICRGHTQAVVTVAWSPDGNSVASGSIDGTVRLWDAMTGEQKYIYRGHTDSVNCVCWSPDGSYLASGSTDKMVQIVNAATGDHIFTYRGHSGTVSSVSWSPDGKHIVSGSWDKTAQVWEAVTGNLVYTYQGYNVKATQANPSAGVLPDLIFVVAWSPNGKRIAAVTQVYCGDNCGVVVSWDAETQRNVAFSIDMPVFALAWSPDATRFATATEVTTQGNSMVKTLPPEDGPYVQLVEA